MSEPRHVPEISSTQHRWRPYTQLQGTSPSVLTLEEYERPGWSLSAGPVGENPRYVPARLRFPGNKALISRIGPCLIFVLQGQISVQVPRVPPASDLRPSLQALVKRLLQNSYYGLINRISAIKVQKDGNVLRKQSFGAGDSIGVLRPDAAEPSSSAHVSLFDITSDRDCWAMEIHDGSGYTNWDACIGQWRPTAVYSC